MSYTAKEIVRMEPKTTKTNKRCTRCKRALRKHKDGTRRWIHSPWTHAMYCWPGEGCNVNKRSKP